MKTKITLLLLFLNYTALVRAQTIPNGSFEFWNSSHTPVGWTTYEDMIAPIQGSLLSEKDTIDKRHGNASIKLTNRYIALAQDTITGMVALGTGFFDGQQPKLYGMPFVHRPDTLFFSYKYLPSSSDTAGFQIQLHGVTGGYVLAIAGQLQTTNGQWVEMAVPLTPYYQNAGFVDSLLLVFYSSYLQTGISSPLGSVLHVDGVSFSGSSCDYSEVGGTLFFDINQNNIQDVNEPGVKNQVVEISGGLMAVTGTNGNFYAALDTGVYILRPELKGALTGFIMVPDSVVLNVDTLCGNYFDNNFAITPAPGYCAGELSVVNLSPPPRPGFTHQVMLDFSNEFSASALSPVVRMTYDADIRFVSSAQTPTNIDTVLHVITWNLSSIVAGGSWHNVVTFYSSPMVSIGTNLSYSVDIDSAGCAGVDSLSATHVATVVGSYDPNDKSVSPPGQEPGGQILSSTSLLTYTIRFQNTGTYAAENVNIVDTISSYLDLSTLKVLAASHNYQVVIDGRQVTFRFANIQLPDSNANEPQSHGFIQYSISPNANFVQSSVVTNRADIYFDFNAPVLTNTTVSTANNFLSIPSLAEKPGPDVYPNPAASKIFIEARDIPVDLLRIYSVSGQLLMEVKQPGRVAVEITSLSPGVYIAELSSNKTVVKRKLVKM